MITQTETFINDALFQLKSGNEGDATYHPLYNAWISYRRNPSQLKEIQDYGNYGLGLMIFLSYGTVTDIDFKQQIASISYLFLSKAIKGTPCNINLVKNRLLLMILYHDAFEYTVSSAVNENSSHSMSLLFALDQFKARDALYTMVFSDLSRDSNLLSVGILKDKFNDLKRKIESDFFGEGKTMSTIIQIGQRNHEKVLEYLEQKVLEDEDIEF